MAETATCPQIRVTSINAYANGTGLYDAAFTTCSEINLLDSTLTPLSRAGWTATADTEEIILETAPASNVLDGNNATLWHSQYNGSPPGQPHTMTINMGGSVSFSYLRWRNRDGSTNGCVGDYTIECYDGSVWNLVASGAMNTAFPPTISAEFDIPITFSMGASVSRVPMYYQRKVFLTV